MFYPSIYFTYINKTFKHRHTHLYYNISGLHLIYFHSIHVSVCVCEYKKQDKRQTIKNRKAMALLYNFTQNMLYGWESEFEAKKNRNFTLTFQAFFYSSEKLKI